MSSVAPDPGDDLGGDEPCPQHCLSCGTRIYHQDDLDAADPDAESDDDSTSWPWECLNCGTTIFHDGECCVPCRSAYYASTHAGRPSDSMGFVEWIRRESLPAFVLKTTGIAGIELGLTAFWLLVFLGDPFALGQVASLAM